MVLEIQSTMCACGSEVETTEHFLVCYHLYSPQRVELFGNLEKIDSSFLNLNVKEKVSFLFIIWFSISNFQKLQSFSNFQSPQRNVQFVINYIKETGRFDRHLFCPNQ